MSVMGMAPNDPYAQLQQQAQQGGLSSQLQAYANTAYSAAAGHGATGGVGSGAITPAALVPSAAAKTVPKVWSRLCRLQQRWMNDLEDADIDLGVCSMHPCVHHLHVHGPACTLTHRAHSRVNARC